MRFYVDKERDICKEIMAWSDHTLQKPNPYYNGLPPCPYAQKAWEDEKVLILFKYNQDWQVLIVDMAFDQDSEKFHGYLEGMNEAISEGVFIDRDIWLMGFHPHDEANDFIDDSSFMHMVEDEYAMVFVQRLSKVQEAADKLAKKGYYDNYLEEYNAEEIFQKRADLYRRLKQWQ